MRILGIDTTGKILSIAIGQEGKVIHTELTEGFYFNSQKLIPLVEEILKKLKLTINDIDVLAVATGPGSFTGTRVGVATIKAMGYALNKKCIGISTLDALAACAASKIKNGNVYSFIDARHGNVYYGKYKINNNKISSEKISGIAELKDLLESCDENTFVIGLEQGNFIKEYDTRASWVVKCAFEQDISVISDKSCYEVLPVY